MAFMFFACAPAKDDSDWDKSESVICPISNLVLSFSTWRISKFKFLSFISIFSIEATKLEWASIAL